MRALITGITGQDGSYLAELLLAKGYEVHGLVRRKATNEFPNIDHILKDITIHYGDILDQTSLGEAVQEAKPDEFYNLAAQSFVGLSWSNPTYTIQTGTFGPLNVLEVLRKLSPTTRIYQASSSEMFGNNNEFGKKFGETSPMIPASPYGVGKLGGHRLCEIYRRSYKMHVSSGICFNHESPRRGVEFVSRKIARAAAYITSHDEAKIPLGNLESWRDWGYAPEFVQSMHLMLQQDEPDDYVIGTGQAFQVKDMVVVALEAAGLEPDLNRYVKLDKTALRPWDLSYLCADISKIQTRLGWKAKVLMPELIKIMVKAEL
jgi:GDPmannose 4,6-dehydratase